MPRPKGRTSIKVTISMTPDTKERLLTYADQNHIRGGISGAIAELIWKAKVKDGEMRGQGSLNFEAKNER